MKTRYKYALVFTITDTVLSLIAIFFVYEPTIPNGDLGMIVFPNIIIPLLLTDRLPRIFGYWSNLYWGVIFWLIIGFIIGLIVEKVRLRKLNKQKSI
jgi:hypothetical protein